MIYVPPNYTDDDAKSIILSLCRSLLDSPSYDGSQIAYPKLCSYNHERFVMNDEEIKRFSYSVIWSPSSDEIDVYRNKLGPLFKK
jgi:hypothetical protein